MEEYMIKLWKTKIERKKSIYNIYEIDNADKTSFE